MAPSDARRVLAATCLLGALVLGFTGRAGAAPADGPLVDVVEVSGVLDATIADHLRDAIARAESSGAEVLVVQLDTPGGLGASMEQAVRVMTASQVPVAVWVGPSGAQAASAGAFVAYAAHVLALAPATTLGAATPVDLGGDAVDTAARNAAEGRLVALAELRGRDVDFARRAVRDGAVIAVGDAAALPEDAQLPATIRREAVELVGTDELVSRRLADVVAASLPDLLAALDGRRVEVAAPGGATQVRVLDVDQATATVRFHSLGLVRQALHTVANPTLAYLLFIAGALAMLFEVFQPGFGVAGVAGLVLLGLALYGLSVLSVNWLAVGVLLLGLALLAADLAVAGLGAPTAGGATALAVGSFLLFSGSPVLRVSPWVVAGVVTFNLLFFVVIMTTVLRAQGAQAVVGAEAMAGKVAVVRSTLNPEGHVFVDGALWRARAPDGAGKVTTGTKVRVLGLHDRLTLAVDLVDDDADDRSQVG